MLTQNEYTNIPLVPVMSFNGARGLICQEYIQMRHGARRVAHAEASGSLYS